MSSMDEVVDQVLAMNNVECKIFAEVKDEKEPVKDPIDQMNTFLELGPKYAALFDSPVVCPLQIFPSENTISTRKVVFAQGEFRELLGPHGFDFYVRWTFDGLMEDTAKIKYTNFHYAVITTFKELFPFIIGVNAKYIFTLGTFTIPQSATIMCIGECIPRESQDSRLALAAPNIRVAISKKIQDSNSLSISDRCDCLKVIEKTCPSIHLEGSLQYPITAFDQIAKYLILSRFENLDESRRDMCNQIFPLINLAIAEEMARLPLRLQRCLSRQIKLLNYECQQVSLPPLPGKLKNTEELEFAHFFLRLRFVLDGRNHKTLKIKNCDRFFNAEYIKKFNMDLVRGNFKSLH